MGIWTRFPKMVARRLAPAFMAIATTVATGLIAVIAEIPTDAVSAGATDVAAMVAVAVIAAAVITAAAIAADAIAAAVIAAAAIAAVVIAVPKAGPVKGDCHV